MDKKLIITIVLSVAILSGWQLLVSKFYPIENKVVVTNVPVKAAVITNTSSIASSSYLPPAVKYKDFLYKNSLFECVFAEESADIKSVKFTHYKDQIFNLGNGFLIALPELNFKKVFIDSEKVVFRHIDNEKEIEKTYLFSNNYSAKLTIRIKNLTQNKLVLPEVPLIAGELNFGVNAQEARYQDVLMVSAGKTAHFNGLKNLQYNELERLGFRDQYFCVVVEPENKGKTAFTQKIDSKKAGVGINLGKIDLNPGQEYSESLRLYIGPQDLKILNSINKEWSAVVYYGVFDIISQLLLQLLELLHNIVRSWGVAIILFSLIIYAVLFPLTHKQMHSMKEMQILQPKVAQLRIANKNNPQKLNKEIMELYKEHKVNPLGGCLPMLLQIPIFFALYQTLSRSIVIKGAQFLWINDLAQPDNLALFGSHVNILPILMAAGMFIQQKITLPTDNSEMAQQQKMMAWLMPIIFGFAFYKMPAGLVIYWLVNSILTLVYQIKVKKSAI